MGTRQRGGLSVLNFRTGPAKTTVTGPLGSKWLVSILLEFRGITVPEDIDGSTGRDGHNTSQKDTLDCPSMTRTSVCGLEVLVSRR